MTRGLTSDRPELSLWKARALGAEAALHESEALNADLSGQLARAHAACVRMARQIPLVRLGRAA
jgi:hypothetical protein